MPNQAPVSGHPQARRPLDTDRVPVLPPGVPYLMETLNDEAMTFIEVARAIEQVPSVAARLLGLANSAWSAPASPITSIEAACSRLGLRVVRTASIALAISQPFNPARCPPFDGPGFWSSALVNAEAAGWIAARVCREEVATARTAGLLSNLGLAWLAEAMPTQTALALETARGAPGGDLDRRLYDACGVGYAEAGALLAEAWQLPLRLRTAIAEQTGHAAETQPLSRVLRGATRLSGCVRRGQPWQEADPGLLALGLEPGAQQACFSHLADTAIKTREIAEALFG